MEDTIRYARRETATLQHPLQTKKVLVGLILINRQGIQTGNSRIRRAAGCQARTENITIGTTADVADSDGNGGLTQIHVTAKILE